MPLPLLLVGGAVVAGLWGAKKTVDAVGDFSDAKEINEDAESIYESAKDSLERAKEETKSGLEALGRCKGNLYKEGVIPFNETFSRIKHIDFDEIDVWGDPSMDAPRSGILQLRDVALRMEEVLGGGASALGSGALVGLAAYGSVGLFGAASTGASIAGLSGVAATNATLAWLGGGSLAAGGLGMAGGTAVLGGIVAAPVLLVAGSMLASKAEEAKENARINKSNARAEAERVETAKAALKAIGRKAKEVDRTLRKLDRDFLAPDLIWLRGLVEGETDYRRYSPADKKRLCRARSVACTAMNLLDAPLLDKEGAITKEIRQTLRRTKKTMDDLRAM